MQAPPVLHLHLANTLGAADVAQLVDCLSRIHEALDKPPHKADMVAPTSAQSAGGNGQKFKLS